jgi:hypothetical protein
MTFAPKQQLSKVRGKKRYSAWLKLNAKRLKDGITLQVRLWHLLTLLLQSLDNTRDDK